MSATLVPPNHRYLSGLNPDTAAAAAVTPSSAHALPERPSVAVLPFTNLGGDGEQEYVADGIAEDIITELSRFGGLFVVARIPASSGKASHDIRKVGRDLGVRYVLEGSVRKASERVRSRKHGLKAPNCFGSIQLLDRTSPSRSICVAAMPNTCVMVCARQDYACPDPPSAATSPRGR